MYADIVIFYNIGVNMVTQNKPTVESENGRAIVIYY